MFGDSSFATTFTDNGKCYIINPILVVIVYWVFLSAGLAISKIPKPADCNCTVYCFKIRSELYGKGVQVFRFKPGLAFRHRLISAHTNMVGDSSFATTFTNNSKCYIIYTILVVIVYWVFLRAGCAISKIPKPADSNCAIDRLKISRKLDG